MGDSKVSHELWSRYRDVHLVCAVRSGKHFYHNFKYSSETRDFIRLDITEGVDHEYREMSNTFLVFRRDTDHNTRRAFHQTPVLGPRMSPMDLGTVEKGTAISHSRIRLMLEDRY